MADEKNTAAEVGVKLVLNSNAEAEAKHIASGLKTIDAGAKKVSDGFKTKLLGGMKGIGGFAMGASAAAIAAAAAGGAALVGLGKHSMESFQAADEELRGIAGTLMTIDQNANAFEDLHEYADDVKNVLEDIGIEAGVADDKTAKAFNNIIEHGGKTVEETQELVKEMALAGKVIPGGLDAISSGYEQIQLGMVRAKNPLVQLISATGTLKGNAKSVAKEMQKMSPEEQMKLAEKAVAKFSEKMKDVPLTLAQMGEGIDIVKGNVFEAAGKPILEQVEKGLAPIHKWIVANQQTLYELGDRFGAGIGKGVEVAAKFGEQAWMVAGKLWEQMKSVGDSLLGPAQDVFGYIYDNADTFAKTFGDVLKEITEVSLNLVKTFADIRNDILGIAKSIGKSGLLGGEIQSFIGQEEQRLQTKDMQKSVNGLASGASMSDAEFNQRRAKYLESAESSGMSVADAAADFDKAYRNAYEQHRKTLADVSGAEEAAMNDDAKKFAQIFEVAAKTHDEGAMQYVARFLEGNISMQNAIAKEGPAIFANGMGAFMDTLKAMGDKDIAAYLKDRMKPNLGKPSKSSITQNFNGNINVKQDFRDQDPDRVAVTFKRELGKMGSSRLQSRLASPFGF